MNFGKKPQGLMQGVRALLICFALPFSVMAGHAQNVDELQAIMASEKCSSDYLPYSYLDYGECDAISDVASGTKCVDEIARKNRTIWRWNSFVRNCRASENPTGGSPSLPQRSDVPPTTSKSRSPSSPPAPAANVGTPATSEPTTTQSTLDRDSDEVAALVQRARKLAEAGDIAAARLVLRRAAEAHNAQAALALGGMYDPIVLKELRIYGVVPDIAEARSWYEKAKEYGSAEAPQRLKMLVGREP
jgi:hypothetical protein